MRGSFIRIKNALSVVPTVYANSEAPLGTPGL